MSQLDDMSVLRCPECGKPLELGHDCLGDPPDAARVSRYTVNPAERIREILYVEEIPETAELTYSFDGGSSWRKSIAAGYCAARGHWWVRGSFHALFDWTCSTCGATKGPRV